MIKGNEVVIIGGGQLGRAMKNVFPEATVWDYPEFNLCDANSIRSHFENLSKNVKYIINTAAWTDVDGAEEVGPKQAVAFVVNSSGFAILMGHVMRANLTMVHFSTDYVFDGEKGCWSENDQRNPLNYYGKTKQTGEDFARAYEKMYLIRTSWLIGDNFPSDNSKNFVKTMAGLMLSGREKIEVVDDQFGRLTFTSDLALATKFLLFSEAKYGIYHISGEGKINSWYEIAQEIAENIRNRTDVEVPEIIGISTEEFSKNKTVAKRPRNSDFNLSKIKAAGYEPADNTEKLRNYVLRLLEEGVL